ncbi:hypothetical protein AJ79_08077 [Helicocarpus griseus UAMH5409]|uniref:Zn(2)-C6 fungal-type domain-containing protein n=1 Tax=Helicocarpus griseus UAMH5409 TaxID=1447875 RepID=A0A2B7WWP8_9EURO|nr:hypothetical protein AJ79_08077 [Helicocarpus griseus UAMH5409]
MASAPLQKQATHMDGYTTPPDVPAAIDGYGGAPVSQQPSPCSPSPKHVAFELLLDENSKVRARIPMRVQIFPHDTTDSIVTTVKNFYGIYEGAASGVSFEDENGITLIARYENLRNNMTVYVRVIPCHSYPDNYSQAGYYGHMEGRQRPSLGEPFQHQSQQPAQAPDYGHSPSRPHSRVARKRSISPAGRGRRSVSAQKAPSRSGIKSRGSSTHGSFHDDALAAYSDNDDDHGSMTGSRKARSEQFASSEISMDNILQDGRRKRPKFESSELPLFVPPQVPLTTSTSSISPQRRSTVQEGPSPFARPAQRPYAAQPIPSPQSYGRQDAVYGYNTPVNNMYAAPGAAQHGHRLRDRTNAQSIGGFGNSASRSNSNGILPTPDPTIASCISDEDVAMQLIRLGDVSNFSHGRTSASTVDDAFSGAADASSSTGATTDGAEASEDDDDLPPRSRHKLESSPMLPPGVVKKHHKNLDEILPSCDSSDPSSDDYDGDYQQHKRQQTVKNEFADNTAYEEHGPKAKRPKTKPSNSTAPKASNTKANSSTKANKSGKSRPATTARKNKAPANNSNNPGFAVPSALPPMASPAPSRKMSSSTVNFQHQLAADEEDLSTKPRCQRCRKSKKGCDRQRPCQRCKDAGIGIEGCISEDEGNGRKGRYGRHMGVPVKKTDASASDVASSVASAPGGVEEFYHPTAPVLAAAPAPSSVADKSKKRKR